MTEPHAGSPSEVLRVFGALGLRCFGGPIAHLGYFRAEFVAKRHWLAEDEFADLIALTQFLPGPGSSELGMAIGLLRAGFWGAVCAWLGFTLPSAVAMILFGYGVTRWGAVASSPWLHGLMIVAAAVVAQAVWGMARTLAPDPPRMTLAVAATAMALAMPGTAGQLGAIALGAMVGLMLPRTAPPPAQAATAARAEAWSPTLPLGVFLALLVLLPLVARATGGHALEVTASFYRSGSLVFGGGHVLLPLLSASVVTPGWIPDGAFLAGYGAAQALPGPVFTFAAYLGTAIGGWGLGLVCLVAIFLPGFLLVIGTVPLWQRVRGNATWAAILKGIGAAVVGLVLAALYTPIWTSAILSARDFVLALAAFLLLVFWRVPPWLVVVLGAGGAAALARLG